MSTRRPTVRIPGFGAWLKSQLDQRSLSQNAFAEKVGVGRSTVSRWVHDQQPSGEYIDPISDVLVLDYDLVATKAGYRPAIQQVTTGERESRAALLVPRIDWEHPQAEIVLATLETLAHNAPKPGRLKRGVDST